LIEAPDRPLVLCATDGLYTPGSTFKVVTAAAAIDSGAAEPDDVYEDNGSLNVDGHVITEANRPDDNIDQWTLREGLAFSLNVVFAQVGLQLGPERLWDYAGDFGFGAAVPFDLPVAKGQIASSRKFLSTNPAVADTAFGQGQLQVTPLQMALVAAGIANGGEIMRPYLIARTKEGKSTRETTKPKVWRRVVSTSTANQVRDLMINVVTSGYGGGAAISGLTVGGKTGTAEVGDGKEPHSWFIGFAGESEPKYAVAVLLEHGGVPTAPTMELAQRMLAATWDLLG
jgi:peptidoglycan glycosyltransferase